MHEKLEIFLQGEGLKDVVIVEVPLNAVVRDLIEAAKGHGLLHGGNEVLSLIFIEDGEDALDPDVTLEKAGIEHRSHVHIHRHHRINVTVNFNERQESQEFPPSATVGRVKNWATKVFEMSDVDSTEHILQVTGSSARPDVNTHIGTLVNFPEDQLRFDLVAKVRIEG